MIFAIVIYQVQWCELWLSLAIDFIVRVGNTVLKEKCRRNHFVADGVR